MRLLSMCPSTGIPSKLARDLRQLRLAGSPTCSAADPSGRPPSPGEATAPAGASSVATDDNQHCHPDREIAAHVRGSGSLPPRLERCRLESKGASSSTRCLLLSATAPGQRRPRERPRICASRGQFRSPGTELGAPDRRGRRVADAGGGGIEAIVWRASARARARVRLEG
jgi:hypothetical protein